MDTRDFSVDTIQEIYDIIETLKDQGTLWDSIHDYWCIGEPDAGMLCTYASRDEMTEYYEKYADGMNLTKKKFERIVENVREVDSKYQEVFLESKEELKNVGEMLKNMTEEISLRTLSLDTNHYNQAIGIIEGEDNEKKEELKALIGIAPGTTQESKLLQKIREILKYSVGNGGFEDEIEVESEEASIAQKQKLITQVENLKEKFKNKELTQEELLDKICEIYHVEDYGSQINYSLAFKKYSPEKKARIVSDILSTAMYIMEVDGLDAEKIEEIAQSVKAKSYIEDEIWNMAENVFRGAVMGVNTAVAGKYYTGQAGSGGGSKTLLQSTPEEIANMTRKELQDSLPEGWDFQNHNGRIHIKDENGNYRVRIDPPDKKTNYTHIHIMDENKNPLDINGNIVSPKDPSGHIPYND